MNISEKNKRFILLYLKIGGSVLLIVPLNKKDIKMPKEKSVYLMISTINFLFGLDAILKQYLNMKL